MRVDQHIRDAIVVLLLEGDFISEPDRAELTTSIQRLLAEGQRRFVVDLGGVHHINSCGLGSLVSSLITLRKAGGDLRLAGAAPGVRSIFEMTQLVRVFEFHETVEQALARYGGRAADD